MRFSKQLFALTLFTLSHASHAETIPSPSIIVAPSCLLNKATPEYKTLAKSDTLNLIETDAVGVNRLIAAKHEQESLCGGFMDVSHAWYKKKKAISPQAFLSAYEIKKTQGLSQHYSIEYSKTVTELLKNINPSNMMTTLTSLSHHDDRYSQSENGVITAKEIKNQIETMAQDYGRQDVTVYFVSTGKYKQPSVVAKIGASNEPGIVIGAHMDTLSSTVLEKKPGADDDGSGTATILEAARTLLSSGIQFEKPIYFIWYAAEEVGLVGSQHVVDYFKKNKTQVSAAIQFDMTGYAYHNDPTMWLIDDYVNKSLTSYIETLITYYVKTPVKHTECGYACSDHASWTLSGYAAAAPFEASFYTHNPDIHSGQDTTDKINLSHMTHFAELAVAFAVETAKPVTM